ncbi:hypothetical protein EZV62_000002 [Acer yangbiense]|uniref:Uncharacterized protein n=1 Tax=Acer yangbiense TaxID=1000413 RepID=A0A5C7IPX0_9ROSI|nr:hypothetical protein EZV62_000002 [Acer yangbiense]
MEMEMWRLLIIGRSLSPFLFIFFTILFTSTTIQLCAAVRPLHDNAFVGPVPPISSTPCTLIPGSGRHC